MVLRVIQWTTGNVGRAAVRAIVADPDLELVGVYAHSAAKVGKDAAELCGLPEPTGVTATNDVDALLALAPDACLYAPVFPDLDDMCRLLAAGVNLCSTSAFLTGRGLGKGSIPNWKGDAKARLEEATAAGNTTVYGSGMNPGFANLLAIVASHGVRRVEQVRVLESVNTAAYESPEGQWLSGMGRAIDEPGLVESVGSGSAVFEDAIEVMARTMRVELDDITFDADFTLTTEDEDFGYMTLPKGTIGATDARWRGWASGRDVIVLRVQWVMGNHLETPVELQHGYLVEIDGDPSVSLRLNMLPPKDFDWEHESPMSIGMTFTAMPAVNAIPHVVAAPPGIATYATLPLIAGRITT
jgi:hypothetical protein